MFAFTFSSTEEHDSIWDKRIWHVNGSLLVLRECNYNLTIQEIEFTNAAFWIQAQGLHFTGMHPTNASKFAQFIGTLIQVESNEEDPIVNKSYLHFRVELNLHEPLLPSCKIPRKVPATNHPNGFKIWVEFKYERLPEFYFNCGVLDHFTKECKLQSDISHQVNESNLVLIYGECLCASLKLNPQCLSSVIWMEHLTILRLLYIATIQHLVTL